MRKWWLFVMALLVLAASPRQTDSTFGVFVYGGGLGAGSVHVSNTQSLLAEAEALDAALIGNPVSWDSSTGFHYGFVVEWDYLMYRVFLIRADGGMANMDFYIFADTGGAMHYAVYKSSSTQMWLADYGGIVSPHVDRGAYWLTNEQWERVVQFFALVGQDQRGEPR